MQRVWVYRRKKAAGEFSAETAFQHYHSNKEDNFPHNVCQNVTDEFNPFKKELTYKFTVEDYLQEYFGNEYEWVETKWLRFHQSNPNQGVFFTPDKDWDIKILKKQNWDFVGEKHQVYTYTYNGRVYDTFNYPTTSEESGDKADGLPTTPKLNENNQLVFDIIKKWKPTSLLEYFQVEQANLISSTNSDWACYGWTCIRDHWFTDWWIFLTALYETNMPIKMLFQHKWPVTSWGNELEVDWSVFKLAMQAAYNVLKDKINKSFDDWFIVMQSFSKNVFTHKVKQVWQTYIQNVLTKKYGLTPEQWQDLIDNNVDFSTWVNTKPIITSYGETVFVDFNEEPWNMTSFLTPDSMRHLIKENNFSSEELRKLNGFILDRYIYSPAFAGGNFAPVIQAQNVGEQINYAYLFPNYDDLYTSILEDDPFGNVVRGQIQQTAHLSHYPSMILTDPQNYRNKNGFYSYLAVKATAFVNFVIDLNYTGSTTQDNATVAGFNASFNPSGFYWSVMTKENKEIFSELSNENGIFLIPIPNIQEFNQRFIQKNSVDGENEKDWRLKINSLINFIEQFVGLAAIIDPDKGNYMPVKYNYIDFANNSICKWVSKIDPLTLSDLTLNISEENQEKYVVNTAVYATNQCPNNMLHLCFKYTTDQEQFEAKETPINIGETFTLPVIYMQADGSAYNIDVNSQEHSKYNIELFNRIRDFSYGNFRNWTLKTDPLMISPSVIQSHWLIGSKNALSLRSDLLNMRTIFTDTWALMLNTNYSAKAIGYKVLLNKLKSDTFVWNEQEDILFTLDDRALPYTIDNAAEAYSQAQNSINEHMADTQAQWQFTNRWNKKQLDYAHSYGLAGGIMGAVGGTMSGAAEGMKTAGPIGAIAGAIGGLFSGITGVIAQQKQANLQYEYQQEENALDQRVEQNTQRAKAMGVSASPIDNVIPSNMAQTLLSTNAPNTDFIQWPLYNFCTYEQIPYYKYMELTQAQLFGRKTGLWTPFRDFNIMKNCNFFAMDAESGRDAEIILTIQDYCEEFLKDEWRHLQYFTDENIAKFVKRMKAGMRLWKRTPKFLGSNMIDANYVTNYPDILDTLYPKISENVLDNWNDGRPNVIPLFEQNKTLDLPFWRKFWSKEYKIAQVDNWTSILGDKPFSWLAIASTNFDDNKIVSNVYVGKTLNESTDLTNDFRLQHQNNLNIIPCLTTVGYDDLGKRTPIITMLPFEELTQAFNKDNSELELQLLISRNDNQELLKIVVPNLYCELTTLDSNGNVIAERSKDGQDFDLFGFINKKKILGVLDVEDFVVLTKTSFNDLKDFSYNGESVKNVINRLNFFTSWYAFDSADSVQLGYSVSGYIFASDAYLNCHVQILYNLSYDTATPVGNPSGVYISINGWINWTCFSVRENAKLQSHNYDLSQTYLLQNDILAPQRSVVDTKLPKVTNYLTYTEDTDLYLEDKWVDWKPTTDVRYGVVLMGSNWNSDEGDYTLDNVPKIARKKPYGITNEVLQKEFLCPTANIYVKNVLIQTQQPMIQFEFVNTKFELLPLLPLSTHPLDDPTVQSNNNIDRGRFTSRIFYMQHEDNRKIHSVLPKIHSIDKTGDEIKDYYNNHSVIAETSTSDWYNRITEFDDAEAGNTFLEYEWTYINNAAEYRAAQKTWKIDASTILESLQAWGSLGITDATLEQKKATFKTKFGNWKLCFADLSTVASNLQKNVLHAHSQNGIRWNSPKNNNPADSLQTIDNSSASSNVVSFTATGSNEVLNSQSLSDLALKDLITEVPTTYTKVFDQNVFLDEIVTGTPRGNINAWNAFHMSLGWSAAFVYVWTDGDPPFSYSFCSFAHFNQTGGSLVSFDYDIRHVLHNITIYFQIYYTESGIVFKYVNDDNNQISCDHYFGAVTRDTKTLLPNEVIYKHNMRQTHAETYSQTLGYHSRTITLFNARFDGDENAAQKATDFNIGSTLWVSNDSVLTFNLPNVVFSPK